MVIFVNLDIESRMSLLGFRNHQIKQNWIILQFCSKYLQYMVDIRLFNRLKTSYFYKKILLKCIPNTSLLHFKCTYLDTATLANLMMVVKETLSG